MAIFAIPAMPWACSGPENPAAPSGLPEITQSQTTERPTPIAAPPLSQPNPQPDISQSTTPPSGLRFTKERSGDRLTVTVQDSGPKPIRFIAIMFCDDEAGLDRVNTNPRPLRIISGDSKELRDGLPAHWKGTIVFNLDPERDCGTCQWDVDIVYNEKNEKFRVDAGMIDLKKDCPKPPPPPKQPKPTPPTPPAPPPPASPKPQVFWKIESSCITQPNEIEIRGHNLNSFPIQIFGRLFLTPDDGSTIQVAEVTPQTLTVPADWWGGPEERILNRVPNFTSGVWSGFAEASVDGKVFDRFEVKNMRITCPSS